VHLRLKKWLKTTLLVVVMQMQMQEWQQSNAAISHHMLYHCCGLPRCSTNKSSPMVWTKMQEWKQISSQLLLPRTEHCMQVGARRRTATELMAHVLRQQTRQFCVA
jgi:hypothetical protein